MARLLFKVLLFAIISGYILLLVDSYYKEKRVAVYSGNAYLEKTGNIEVAIFGTSHAYSSYNSKIFEEKWGKNTFNFGTSLQNFDVTEGLIDEVIKQNDLKLIIVDVYSIALVDILPTNDFLKSYQITALDGQRFSIGKIKTFFKIFSLEEIYKISPTLRNHAKWDYILEGNQFILKSNEYFYNGFYTSLEYKEEVFQHSKKEIEKTKYRNSVRKELKAYEIKKLNSIVEKLSASNIPVVYVVSPSYLKILGPRLTSLQQLIDSYFKSKDLVYINLQDHWSELELKQNDFRHPDHLNIEGAKKVTNFLIKYIESDHPTFKSFSDIDDHN